MNTVLLFIIVLGPLIFFHELGHFLFARLFGVGVEKFSLGFGPRIFGKQVGRTDYRLSLIPLGGFVKMVGDEPDADLPEEDIPYSFTHKHVVKRSLIVFAGPLFNVLLALFIFMGILNFGEISSIRPVIKAIDTDSNAERAGLQLGDFIVSVNDTQVDSWRDINEVIGENHGNPLILKIKRQMEVLEITLAPQKAYRTNIYGDEVAYFDFGISGRAKPLPVVGGLVDDMPAKEAGLQAGDLIVSIDGRPIKLWKDMQEMVSGSEGKKLLFGIQRQGKNLDFEIQPKEVKTKSFTGISKKQFQIGIEQKRIIPDEDKVIIKYGLIQSFQESCRILVEITKGVFEFIKQAFRGNVSRELVGGPIKIAVMAKQSADMGMVEFFYFVAAISLQLAILNLLPIPVLDGGHLLFYGIEAVKRGPLSTRARETAQQVGLFLLLLLMVFVIYNDIVFTWFK